jgi:hypothetical protein
MDIQNVDITITAGKCITIKWNTGGFLTKTGSLKNFGWDTNKKYYYFNPVDMEYQEMHYDFLLRWDSIATYNGGAVPSFNVLLAAIITEIKAET